MKRILIIFLALAFLTGCLARRQESASSAAPAPAAVPESSAPSESPVAPEPSAVAESPAAPESSEPETRESDTQTQGTTETAQPDEIWTRKDMPVSVRYDRLWVYSAYGETEDPEILKALVEAIRALEIGGESEWYTEDYTDILTFTFADGDTLRLEFENQSWVKTSNERYEVNGLDAVRAILEMILPGSG